MKKIIFFHIIDSLSHHKYKESIRKHLCDNSRSQLIYMSKVFWDIVVWLVRYTFFTIITLDNNNYCFTNIYHYVIFLCFLFSFCSFYQKKKNLGSYKSNECVTTCSKIKKIIHQSDDRMQILQRFQPHCHFTNFEEVVFNSILHKTARILVSR